jgi:lipoprotein-anchoring transpeptidase ErfK/SrfK
LTPLHGFAKRRNPPSEQAKAPVFEAAAIENKNQPPLSPGDAGSGVLRAQVLLSRAHFSCGELDGHFGLNLQKTVAAFQQAQGIASNGTLDQPTWDVLNRDGAPILTSYTISADDVKGPFVKIPKDIMKQAKLPAMSYSSPLEELGERFHSSPAVLRALNPKADFGKAGGQITAPNAVTMPPGEAARVEVSKAESSVRAFDSSGKLLAFYVASIGSDQDPLPIGSWKILGVRRNPVFHYNAKLFWDAENPNEKASIQPGPNNPVGLVWIDLSKEHYGIHGTPEPSHVGHRQSHGCIRLTNWDALELASMVKPNMPAILRE